MSNQKKKARSSKGPKQPATKVNWIFTADRVSSKEVSSICLRLFTKDKILLDDLFEYAIIGLKEVSKHSYNIIGYLQLGKSKRWTRKDVINHLGYNVKTYSSNDTVFERTEKSLKPVEIIDHIRAISDVDNVTEGGTVRKKGPKFSLKRDDGEDDDDDDDESISDDDDDDECPFIHKKVERQAVEEASPYTTRRSAITNNDSGGDGIAYGLGSSVEPVTRVARATTSLASPSRQVVKTSVAKLLQPLSNASTASPMRISKVLPSNTRDAIPPTIPNYTSSMQNAIEATITRLFEENNSRLISSIEKTISRLVTEVNENTKLIDENLKGLITALEQHLEQNTASINENFRALTQYLVPSETNADTAVSERSNSPVGTASVPDEEDEEEEDGKPPAKPTNGEEDEDST